MEEKIEVGKMAPRKNSPKKRTKVVYPYELRLKAVKLHLDKGISREVISRELERRKPPSRTGSRRIGRKGQMAFALNHGVHGLGKRNCLSL